MDKDSAGLLPKASVLEIVVYKDVATIQMECFVSGSAGDHPYRREVLASPSHLLWLGPPPIRATRQNNGLQVLNCFNVRDDTTPVTVAVARALRVGQHAIAIKKELFHLLVYTHSS